MNSSTPEKWKHWLPLLILMIAGGFFRVWGALMFSASYSMDHAVPCLMAKHIAEGKDLPVFYYGQPYMGSLEPLVSALFFLLPIDRNFACNLGGALFGILLLPLIYYWARKIAGRFAGLSALAFLVIGPPVYMQFMNWSYGGYAALTFLGTAILLSGLRILEVEQESPTESPVYLWILTGVLAGIGWWTSFLLIPFMLTLAILFLFKLNRRILSIKTGLALAGFAVGSAPFWLWNIRHNWGSFRFVMKDTTEANLPEAVVRTLRMIINTITDHRSTTLTWIVASIILSWLIIVAIRVTKTNRRESPALYMVAIPVLLAVYLFFFASKPTRIGPSRYCMALLPSVAVWLGVATATLAKKLGKAAPLATLPLLALIALQTPMLKVCHGWYNERKDYFASLDRLGGFLRHNRAHVMYAGYGGRKVGYGLNFYFNEKFVFTDPIAHHYLPYLQAAESTDNPAVFQNPYAFQRLFLSSGGSCDIARLDNIVLYHNFRAPDFDMMPTAIPTRITDTNNTTDWKDKLTDRNYDTYWVNNRKPARKLLIEWQEPQTIHAINLVANSDMFPEYVTIAYRDPTNGLVTLDEKALCAWFWTPSRPFCGGNFYRQTIRLPAITTTKLSLTFNREQQMEPVRLAELSFYTPAPPPSNQVTNLPKQLVATLKKNHINALYCDRDLAATLYRDGPDTLMLSLDPSVFPENSRLLPDFPMRLTTRSALLTLNMHARESATALAQLDIHFKTTTIGRYTLFVITAIPNPTDSHQPLRWLGYTPIISDSDYLWRKNVLGAANRALHDGRLDAATQYLEVVRRIFPDYIPALMAAIHLAEKRGKTTLAESLKAGAAQLDEPTIKLNAVFKNGYTLRGMRLAPQKDGERIILKCTCYWQTSGNPSPDSTAVFIHILDNHENIITQDDYVINEANHFCTVTDKNRFIARRTITLPVGTRPDYLHIKAGLYQANPPFKRVKIRKAAVPVHNHHTAVTFSLNSINKPVSK